MHVESHPKRSVLSARVKQIFLEQFFLYLFSSDHCLRVTGMLILNTVIFAYEKEIFLNYESLLLHQSEQMLAITN